jgi:hypothetical protein
LMLNGKIVEWLIQHPIHRAATRRTSETPKAPCYRKASSAERDDRDYGPTVGPSRSQTAFDKLTRWEGARQAFIDPPASPVRTPPPAAAAASSALAANPVHWAEREQPTLRPHWRHPTAASNGHPTSTSAAARHPADAADSQPRASSGSRPKSSRRRQQQQWAQQAADVAQSFSPPQTFQLDGAPPLSVLCSLRLARRHRELFAPTTAHSSSPLRAERGTVVAGFGGKLDPLRFLHSGFYVVLCSWRARRPVGGGTSPTPTEVSCVC